MTVMNRKNFRNSRGRSQSALLGMKMTRLMGVVFLAFSLSACSYVRGAVSYAQKAVDYAQNTVNQVLTETSHDAAEETPGIRKMLKPLARVVLRSAPRYLMVKPRTDPVWLWDRPGGFNTRAVRIKKVPSGTPGKVVEFEPESKSYAFWAESNLKNVARQPVRWMKVTTLLGVGWVRAEFVEIR